MPGIVYEQVERQAIESLFDRFYKETVDRGMEHPAYRGDENALDLHAEARTEAAARLKSLKEQYPGLTWTEISHHVDQQQEMGMSV